jgi:hypothetical protein
MASSSLVARKVVGLPAARVAGKGALWYKARRRKAMMREE